MVSQVLLLMAEYGVKDSPLWYRLSPEKIGHADARELGLTAELRRDLQAWNNVFFSVDGPDSPVPPADADKTFSADAFDFAARIQVELGDEAHVWCGNAGWLGTSPNGTKTLVVASKSVGTTVEQRSGRSKSRIAVEAAGGRDETARAIVRWRGWTNRVGAPFGNAQTRSEGLRAAGALQSDVGEAAEVIFFGGAHSPRDYSADDRPL